MATLTLQPTLTLYPESGKGKHWIVIGAGGNGGYFIPKLARACGIANHRLGLAGQAGHVITVIDKDDVEEKNLNRQNFIRQDIGQLKAEVMVRRYGRAFGLEMNVVDKYLDSPKMLLDIIKSVNLTPVIVGAVDNNKTRKLIYDVWRERPNTWWIDAGNEEWGGQVTLGHNRPSAKPNKETEKKASQPQSFHVPCVVDLYPEILMAQDKLPHEQSCAERAVSAPQNIYTNEMAATLMMGFANHLINDDHSKNQGLKHHAVMFNAYSGSQTTRLNTLENLIVPEPKLPENWQQDLKVEASHPEPESKADAAPAIAVGDVMAVPVG